MKTRLYALSFANAGNINVRGGADYGNADLVLEFNKGDYVLLNHIGMPCNAMAQYDFNREFTVVPSDDSEPDPLAAGA